MSIIVHKYKDHILGTGTQILTALRHKVPTLYGGFNLEQLMRDVASLFDMKVMTQEEVRQQLRWEVELHNENYYFNWTAEMMNEIVNLFFRVLRGCYIDAPSLSPDVSPVPEVPERGQGFSAPN